ncbi:MAG TPA: hypothetical protein VGO36_00315 [Solirubrobacterales bacterium]|jgi:Mrp family chromosome partitioning ATPase|nr:hypothetical protein [Solirubrobacterales bacterium]
MPGGRRKLPVLAEIGTPPSGPARAWSLRRADLAAMSKLQGELEDRCIVLGGEQAPAVALALASAASAAGRRTALVECDLERPRLAADLGLAPAPGLHEYLRWEATAPQILQPLVLAGPAAGAATAPLVCVVAGRPAKDPETLSSLESFRHAVAKLRGAYDLVVLAGPPPGSSALPAIAAEADVLLASSSPQALAGRAGRALRAALRKLPVETRGTILIAAA